MSSTQNGWMDGQQNIYKKGFSFEILKRPVHSKKKEFRKLIVPQKNGTS